MSSSTPCSPTSTPIPPTSAPEPWPNHLSRFPRLASLLRAADPEVSGTLATIWSEADAKFRSVWSAALGALDHGYSVCHTTMLASEQHSEELQKRVDGLQKHADMLQKLLNSATDDAILTYAESNAESTPAPSTSACTCFPDPERAVRRRTLPRSPRTLASFSAPINALSIKGTTWPDFYSRFTYL